MQSASAAETIQRLILSLSELEQLSKTIVSGQDNFGASSQRYLRIVLDTLHMTRGAILRFDPTQSRLVVESSINIKDESLVIPVTPTEVTLLLPSSIIDISHPPPALKPFLNQIQPQLGALGANLWTLLKIAEEFLGVISLGSSLAVGEMADWAQKLATVLTDHISIAIVHSRSQEETRAAKFRLFLLSDITAQIAKLLDAERLEGEVVHHAVSLLDASAGCLMLIDPFTQRLEMKSHFALDSQPHPNLKDLSIAFKADLPGDKAGQAAHLLLSMLRGVVTEGKTQIHNDEKTVGPFGRRNLMAAPVFGREILGVLVIFDKQGRDGVTLEFTGEDGILLEAFATQVGVAIENARLYQEAIEKRRLQAEMEEAAKIQENLLPKAPPEISGYDVAGLSIPRRDGVGGDYYDYIQEPDGSYGFVIADVAGKGMQAALLVATLRAYLRSEVAKQKDLPSIAMALNSLLYESSPLDRYATLFYAQLQPETGELTSINAGHNYPLVIRRDGSLKRLEEGGLILGMYPDHMLCQIVEYEQEMTQLYSGDTVLLYTDGVTDTLNSNSEAYEEERLEKLVTELRHASAGEICTAIYNAVTDFQGEARQFDDLTLMVLKKE